MYRLICYVIFVFALCVISACRQTDGLGSFQSINAEGWSYGDSISLKFESEDSLWEGDIAIAVRHTAAYPYSNIWLEITSEGSDTIIIDTLNVVLADDFGNWLGKGLGLSYQLIDTPIINRNFILPSEISVRHIMRTDLLTDIEQIGLLLLPTNNRK